MTGTAATGGVGYLTRACTASAHRVGEEAMTAMGWDGREEEMRGEGGEMRGEGGEMRGEGGGELRGELR